MELLIFFAVIAILVFSALARGGFSSGGGGGGGGLLTNLGMGSDEAQLTATARSYGVTLHNTYLIHSGDYSRYDSGISVYGFSGVDKAGVLVTGQIRIGMGPGSIAFDNSGAGARAARAQAKLHEAENLDESTLDPEEQVRREVARRLDTLQGNRDAFLANDTDGDGIVDEEEWAAARARIEAQVRQELGATPSPAPPTPAPTPPRDGEW